MKTLSAGLVLGKVSPMRIDISKSEAKKCKLGDMVEVTVRGKIISLDAPPDEAMGMSPSMGIDVKKQTLRKLGGKQEEGIRDLNTDEDY